MSTKRVIILGGAGFLGFHIAQALLHDENIHLAYADVLPNPKLSIEYTQINVLESASLDRLGDFDIVVNCTGQVTKPFNLCYRLNTEGIGYLLNALSDTLSRVIQISTTSVYGSGDHCDESSPLNPETNYATAKAAAEYLLQDGLEPSRLTILRLSNLYGPGQQKGIAAYILRSFFSDRKLHFNNNGNLIRSFLHVQDAARLIARSVLQPDMSGVYNVKGPDTLSIMELIERFEKEFHMSFVKEYADKDPWENVKYLDDSRIHRTMDLSFDHDIMIHFKQIVEGPRNG